MSDRLTVKRLEDLLSLHLENGEKIVDWKVSVLTAPGENYGSIMLRIDVQIENKITGEKKTLNTVGKVIPESEMVLEAFNTQVTFRNEYMYYAEIVPTLNKFLKKKGILSGTDFSAPFYGGRINLDGGKQVDRDAIILMENLKSAGYIMGEKAEGFDLETSKVILYSLAKFHAAGLALRHEEPNTFEEKLRPYCHYFDPLEVVYDAAVDCTIDMLRDHGFSLKQIEAISMYKIRKIRKINVNTTWGTMIHYDSWTNNFLLKYDKKNKPMHAILVDFQIFDYGTPLNDVMFFLFTSVKRDIFAASIDTLLDYYYEQLLHFLKKLGANTQLFTRKGFEEEIKIAVKKYEYIHAVWMLSVVTQESSLDDLSNLSSSYTSWSKNLADKVMLLTKTCFEKGWL